MEKTYLISKTSYSYGLLTLPPRLKAIDATRPFPASLQNTNGVSMEEEERFMTLEAAVKRFYELVEADGPAEICEIEAGSFISTLRVIEIWETKEDDKENEEYLPTDYRYVSPIKGEDLLNLDTHVNLAPDDALSSKMKALELRLGDLYFELKELLRSECRFLERCPSRYEKSDRLRQALANAKYLEEVTNSLKYAARLKAEDYRGRYW